MLNQLKAIGLSDNEAKTYLAMLELGPASVAEISLKAGINRPTVYMQIEALKKNGLATTQTKGKKQLYIAESPDQLERILDRERLGLEQKKNDLTKLLPELETMFRTTDSKPVVRFFEGKEGILKMQREVLKCKEKLIRAISSLDEVYELFPDHGRRYPSERVKRGIRSKFIYTSSKGPTLKESDKSELRESKFIAPERLPITFDFTVFDSTVKIEILKGKILGVVIEHPQIAQSFKNLFDFFWNFIE